MSNPSITADKTPWYQWDTGLTVTVSGVEMDECHFANRKQGTAYVQAVINGVARVPDELLQVAAPIKVYGYVSDGAGGQTYVEQSFEVIARNIPADYTYTKTAQKTIRDAEVARDQAVQAAKDAKASELAADDSAVEASTSAQSAGDSASAAATSASNAAKSAGDAATSASDAATSASNAADAASAASGSARAAAQSATDASNAKVAAQTAKDGAETAASNAATSASNAESSATAAEKSASDAEASVGAINVIAPKSVTTSAKAGHLRGVAIGFGANAAKNSDVVIGNEAMSIPDGYSYLNVLIGGYAKMTNESVASVAIGSGSVISKPHAEFSVGGGSNEYNSPATREITHVSTPTADTSAATKKYTDDNDAKTLTEAKNYTDENTSNALVGTVSGKLLHVEDAWTSKPLSLTIDGAYKQDGTPSPENPVPITVVENPVLKVTGRNLLDIHDGMPESDCNKDFDKTKKRIIKHGTYVAGLTSNNYIKTVTIRDAVFSEGGITFISNAGGYGVGVGVSLVPGETYERTFVATNSACAVMFYASDGTYLSHVGTQIFTVPADAAYTVMLIVPSSVNQPVSATDIFIKRKDTAGTYAPYTSATIPITLHAEHQYLAALPDGTHDEIVIDKDGNASLVARVQKVDVSNLPAPSAYDALDNGLTLYQYWSVIDPPARNDTTILAPAFKSVIDFAFPQQGMYVSNNSIIVGASADPTDALRAGGYIYTTLATPVTYQLGKLDIPSLPETISNVWTDAELTTNMNMTYKRDINIAFENLAQAVVAAAAGE